MRANDEHDDWRQTGQVGRVCEAGRVIPFPLVEEARQQGKMIQEFERGLLGGLLCTGRRTVDQFLIAQGDGDPGDTANHSDDRSDHQALELRTIYRRSEAAPGA